VARHAVVIRRRARDPERSEHVQVLLGAYVLGGLSREEEAAVAAHLLRCAQCQAEYEELADVPPWLDLLKPADGDPPPGQA
jgi:anti-sigma factor RsiW